MSQQHQNNPEKINLPQAAKEHFSNIQLSDTQLEHLTALQEKVPFKQRVFNSLSYLKTLLGYRTRLHMATALLLLFTTAATLLLLPSQDKAWQVLNEVAYNHNKQMSLEITSEDIGEISTYLSQLDFSLVNSGVLNPEQWQLLGGRYCSIDGQLAAQLKVRNKNDQQIYTFYQALAPEQMPDISSEFEGYADGVKVRLWKERGLLMGLAGQSLP